MVTRRQLLKASALAGAGLVLPWRWNVPPASASAQIPQTPLPGSAIPKYVDQLPTFIGARVDGTKKLRVTMEEFQQNVLPAAFYAGLPAPYEAGTYLWGYAIFDGANTHGPLYPAFTIEARRNTPTTLKYVNDLVNPVLQKYLTVDQTLHWADPLEQMGSLYPYAGPVPAVTHLHGGEVPSAFDGGPNSWFTPGTKGKRIVGPGFVSDLYTYPNGQEATTLFFHDHTLGATRLNLYAGLVGFYLIRDNRDTGLADNLIGLPAGNYEIEIAIQDRMFDTNGQMLFPDFGINPEHPFWVPEFFGDVIVVNGKTWPYLNVEPRRYRFRFVDGSNARFYKLSLGPQLPFWQIGTDGGLLDTPAMVNELFMSPGERADVIVDFATVAGQRIIMTNSAKAPFPAGTPADPQTVGQIMEFRVNLPLSSKDDSYNPETGQPLRSSGIVRLASGGALAPGVRRDLTRQLTLIEIEGSGGPLEVLLNNSTWAADLTEMPKVGATEVWEIINLTADAHPIHVHLVQFQLINRQSFNVSQYTKVYSAAFPGGEFTPAYGPPTPYGSTPKLGGNPDVTPYLQGAARPPEPNEKGWKDTFKMFPGEVTRIVVRWAPQDIAVSQVSAGTNKYPFDPSSGPGYVWHCHIVDHEDNEMMRPYTVKK